MPGGDCSHEHNEIDRRKDVVGRTLVVYFDPVFSEDADVPHVVLVAVEELKERLCSVNSWIWVLLSHWPNLPHVELSMSLARTHCPGFLAMLAGSKVMLRGPGK